MSENDLKTIRNWVERYHLRVIIDEAINDGNDDVFAINEKQRDFMGWATWTDMELTEPQAACNTWKQDQGWVAVKEQGLFTPPFPYVAIDRRTSENGEPYQSERRSVEDVMGDLKFALFQLGFERCLGEYFGTDLDRKSPFPSFHWIACFAVGGSEGYYVHIEVIRQGQRQCVFLGKTFYGFDYAWEAVKAIAKILQA